MEPADLGTSAWSGDTPLAGLPRPLSSLVGRERELDELEAIIEDERAKLVTLTGTGGTGKTRMAIAVAEVLAPRFAQVQFLPLVTVLQAEAIPGIIAARLGLRDVGVIGVSGALESSFARHSTLLVLDNLEHLEGVGLVIAALLALPVPPKILATSRVRLALPGEVVYPVQPLSFTPTGQAGASPATSSTRLFLQRVIEHHPGFVVTPDRLADIDAICTELEGLPLAIELAAARCRIMTPGELRHRLLSALDVLSGNSPAHAEHQRTMRKTIAWSVGLLDGPSRDLFEQIAAFGGPIDRAATEALLADDVAGDALRQLIEHHLLVPELTLPEIARFRFPAAIREFAAEQLAVRADRDLVNDRMAHYMHGFVQTATEGLRGPDIAHWTRRLDVEMPNIIRALAWLEEHRPPDAFADILVWMQPFWLVRGRYDLADDWLERGLGLIGDPAGPDQSRQNGLLVSGSRMALGRGDIGRARELIDRVATDETDLWTRAKTFEQRGKVELRAGSYMAAIEQFDQAREVSQQLDNAEAEAWSLHGMAAAWLDLGAMEQAEQTLTIARERYEVTGNAHGVALITDSLSQVRHAQGRTEEAIALAQAALTVFQQASNYLRAGIALDNIGRYERALGHLDRSRRAHLKAADLYRQAGDPSSFVTWLRRIVALMRASDDQAAAEYLFAIVDPLRQRYGGRITRLEQRELDYLQPALITAPHVQPGLPAYAPRRGPTVDEAVHFALVWLDQPLQEMSEHHPDHPALASLTPREREIVGLVAEGLTDQQVADNLGISIRTVGKHLTTAYSRLGISSRKDAARLVNGP